ncbi:hypothetical protein FUA23_04275 [Neolewinella aurantiaca]|uniref:Uncharacterized protein n=1 Tax=Neolewinella aurantiaca TaxID=2602767 RepID=A0A5C7FZ60_9BACT|nr:hypothetical protein [Neolewinella aurantiaca]TXF91027.1 hypothetical protein FUA23_04275 [Neolewinella aurantiaca]
MPPFREKLLTEVTGICRQLYQRRLALVKTQALVSEDAKQDVIALVLRLNRLRALTPFPAEQETDMAPLEKLKAGIDDADADQFAIQEELIKWVNEFHPQTETAADGEVAPEDEKGGQIPPVNQRMIDNLASFRSAIDRTRLNLMLAGDSADPETYTAARNAFTLARAVYDERLRLNQITTTNADCAKMEQVLIPDVRDATGATFPGTIQAGADFISDKLFV